jgi:two-component system chemotaxis response regulator CheB
MSIPAPATSDSARGVRAPIQVMIVDDSAVVRGLTVRILESDSAIKVVATCSNGQIALQQLARRPVDVIILDIEMPVMDGLTALPLLLKTVPGVQIIIASTLSQRNAIVSMQALAQGATDYIPKPSTTRLGANDDYRRDLLHKVRALGRRRAVIAPPSQASAARPTPTPRAPGGLILRPPMQVVPQILAIGSSTGGPQALLAVLRALPASIDIPILIAQHMPAAFTPYLAQHIAQASGRPCREAVDGMPVLPGTITVAPGDFHLEVVGTTTKPMARLTKGPAENFCRPSVNPLLRSLAGLFGMNTLAVMLTGMGSDGLDGAQALIRAGGALIAQDEQSSVVWGMPGAVANAGLCSAVLPLTRIAPEIERLVCGSRS